MELLFWAGRSRIKELTMAGDNPGPDYIWMGFYLCDNFLRDRGLNIYDIIADLAVTLIHVARDVNSVAPNYIGGKTYHTGDVPVYHDKTGMTAS